MWRAASRVGCSAREEMRGVRAGSLGFGGGGAREAVWRRCVERVVKVGGG